MASSSTCGLSRQKRRHLHVNTPQWRVIISLRMLTALVAGQTIVAFAICIGVPLNSTSNASNGGISTSNAWQWGDVWIESFAFVPPAVSLVQTVVTISYLLTTTHLTHPAIELVTEITLVLVAAFPIVFCATVSGPLQHWQTTTTSSSSSSGSGSSSSVRLTNNDELAGVTELLGFIGLCILETVHLGFFITACRRMHVRRKNKIALARAAAAKLEAGWGGSDCEDYGVVMGRSSHQPPPQQTGRIGEEECDDDVKEILQQPRPILEHRNTSTDVIPPTSAESFVAMARETSNVPPKMEKRIGGARRPSSVSALSSRYGRRSSSWGRRPSSLDAHPSNFMPQGRRRTELSEIGVAVGKPHEIWVPITELRSESPLTPHRMVEDHEVVIVGDGEVKVVSTPREEAFVGWTLPEPSTSRTSGDETEVPKKQQSGTQPEGKMAIGSPDPDVPAPLKVRKSVKSFKLGNSWEIDQKLLPPSPPVADQGVHGFLPVPVNDFSLSWSSLENWPLRHNTKYLW